LDTQHHAVLRIGGIVQSILVGQQHVLKAAEPHQLCPVLIVADQSRQFACGNESRLVGQDGFGERLEIGASMLRTAGLTGISIEQHNQRWRPAERGDMIDHGLLA
jgi:hypothetical protein